MTINKRVKMVREAKELSMIAFGKAIGLSHSGISAIEYETRSVTDKNIKLICVTFNVNEQWLRTGEGDMFVRTERTMLAEIAKKNNLDCVDTAIIENYIALPPSAREAIKGYIRSLSEDVARIDGEEICSSVRADPAFSNSIVQEPNAEA